MSLIGTIPRRCVNLPPGSFRALSECISRKQLVDGPAMEGFPKAFGGWLGVPFVFGASSGRTAFQLALEALDLKKGAEIIFPSFTFPVMPMVAKILGYTPVFCDVDPETFNSGPEHVEQVISEKTGAVLATHLFGQPCLIDGIVELAKKKNIRVMEDCAHACGVRIKGKQAGTFGDVGIFSFAEGKNMPCFGGGAIATADEAIAARAQDVLVKARIPPAEEVKKHALSVCMKWLLTRPFIFGVIPYQVLHLKLLLGQPLMDSAVGDELLDSFVRSNPRVTRMANLQAAVGLLHLNYIDDFNNGARRNARVLTERIGSVPGVKVPGTSTGDHIYVYYPLVIEPAKRKDLRHYLLRHGIDTKTTDMSDCAALAHFHNSIAPNMKRREVREASILEICVYPVLSEQRMHHVARIIRAWAGLPGSP